MQCLTRRVHNGTTISKAFINHTDAFDFDVYTVSLDAPFLDTSSWTVA